MHVDSVPTAADFLSGCFKTPDKIPGVPTFATLSRLKGSLLSNATLADTYLRDSAYSFVAILVTAAEYETMAPGTPFEAPTRPTDLPAAAEDATNAELVLQNYLHEVRLEKWLLYNNVHQALKQQLLDAVDSIYLQYLRDSGVDFLDVSMEHLLTSLFQRYGNETRLPRELFTGEVAERIARMMNDTTISNPTEMYKGVQTAVREVRLLCHIVDSMKDHFNKTTTPNVKFVVDGLKNLGYNEAYKCKGAEPENRWYSKVDLAYNDVNVPEGESKTYDLMAMDNVYLDLIPKTSKSGAPVSNYGITWLNMYIPVDTLSTFCAKFRDDTGWGVDATTFTKDTAQGVSSTTVSMDATAQPMFRRVAKEVDEDGEFTGAVHINTPGTVQELAAENDTQAIYHCTCFFNVSMSVMTPIGHAKKPLPTDRPAKLAKLKFTLLGVRAFNEEDDIVPVQFGCRYNPDRIL